MKKLVILSVALFLLATVNIAAVWHSTNEKVLGQASPVQIVPGQTGQTGQISTEAALPIWQWVWESCSAPPAP